MAIKIMNDIINHPVFLYDELEKEKKIVLEEYAQNMDSIDSELNHKAGLTVLSDKNEFSRQVIGNKNDISNITVKDLNAYLKKMYSEFIVIVNCDKRHQSNVKELVFKTFGENKNLDFATKNNKDSYFMIRKVGLVKVIDNLTMIQFSTILTFPTICIYRICETVTLVFLKFVLTSAGLNSILFRKIREARGLVYSIHSFSSENRGAGLLQISFSSSNSNTSYIISLVLSCLLDIKKHGLQKKDLIYFKKSLVNKTKYVFLSEEMKEMWYCNNLFYQLDLKPDRYIEMIQNIDNDMIKNVANEVFDFEKMGVITHGNYKEANLPSIIDEIKSTYQKLSNN